MADKTYKADIGMDELNENLFTCLVYCEDDGENLCIAYGKTPEECMINAKRIAWLMTNIGYLKMFASETQRMYDQTMPSGGWQFVHDSAQHFNYGLEQLGLEDEKEE